MPIKPTQVPIDATVAAAQKMAMRSRVQQSIKAGPQGGMPSIFYVKAAATCALAPDQPNKAVGERGAADSFGAADDANRLLVGPGTSGEDRHKNQLFEVGHKIDADVTLPAPQSKAQPITKAKSEAVLTRIAKVRYGSSDGPLAASAQHNAAAADGHQQQSPANMSVAGPQAELRTTARAAFAKAAQSGGPVGVDAPLSARVLPKGGAIRAAFAPRGQVGHSATAAALGTAATASATSQNEAAPAPEADADASTVQSPTTVRLVGTAGDAANGPAAGSAEPSAPQGISQPQPSQAGPSSHFSASPTDALLAKAVKAGDASVGAADALLDATFNKNLNEAWADVAQAGARRQNLGPVNWQAFFNLLAAKNSKLLAEFIDLQRQATLTNSQASVAALKLDKDITETDQSFARAQALLGLARNVYSLQDMSVKSANPILFNESPYLTPTELQLQTGLGNRQMRSPIQRTYQNSFVHQLAGDRSHQTRLLSGDSRESYMNTFRTQKYVEIAAQNPDWTPEQIHREATAHYASQPPAPTADIKAKILTSYTETKTLPNGQTVSTQVPINRNILTDDEKNGLLDADLQQYDRMMQRVKQTLYTDLPGRAEMYLAEIQSLESAASRASRHPEKQALLEKSAFFRAKYADAMANIRGAADAMGTSERGYTDAMRIRGDLEGIRRGAERDCKKLKDELASGKTSQGVAHSDAQKAELQARILVYESMTNSINRKCSIIDDNMLRHFDSRVDNRRGRFKTGVDGVVLVYRDAQKQMRQAQAYLLAHAAGTDAKQRDMHLAALQKAAEQKARLETYPAFFKNPVKLHEELLERICAHRADGAVTFGDSPELFRQFEAALQQQMRAGGDGALSLEAVSRTRMLAHIKERGEELVNRPADDPERQALSAMDAFWRQTTLWPDGGGYAPPPSAPSLLGLHNKTVAARTNIKLRAEREATKNVPDPQDIDNLPTVRHWHNPDGSVGQEVNFNDLEETNRYYSALATVGGNIMGLQNEVKNDTKLSPTNAGAYRDRLGHKIDHFRTFLNNFDMNLGNVDTLVNLASESATNISSDAQESLSAFTSLLAEARQMTEGLVTQLYQLANAKVGR